MYFLGVLIGLNASYIQGPISPPYEKAQHLKRTEGLASTANKPVAVVPPQGREGGEDDIVEDISLLAVT